MAERVRVREISNQEGNRLLRIVRRSSGHHANHLAPSPGSSGRSDGAPLDLPGSASPYRHPRPSGNIYLAPGAAEPPVAGGGGGGGGVIPIIHEDGSVELIGQPGAGGPKRELPPSTGT